MKQLRRAEEICQTFIKVFLINQGVPHLHSQSANGCTTGENSSDSQGS
jgi:hypothetical protein